MNSDKNIENAFLDVRNAYRLLHDFQRMVLDAVAFIGSQFGLTYDGGWPKFSATTPRGGHGKLDCWAWDWLNLMQYEFYFFRELGRGKELWFSVILVSDTGYFSSKSETLQKTDVADFLPAEQARTMVGFIMSTRELNQWKPEFQGDRAAMRSFVEKGGKLPPKFAAPGFVTKCYDAGRLMSEASTSALIDELIVVANGAGIPLERVSRNDEKGK
jgi:hypothetical protein